jgi:Resolvase, N terminal domain
MNPKITPEHLNRGAIVYVRQSTIGQVVEHTESKRRQYALAESARELGFASVSVIDDDLGRSGSGLVERPGFQKLVAAVCGGSVGSVFCIEASRAWLGTDATGTTSLTSVPWSILWLSITMAFMIPG